MVGAETVLLDPVRPHHPPLQWLVQLTGVHNATADPAQQTPFGNPEMLPQFRWPPLVGVMSPDVCH
jgi:hypothetical protein